MGKYICATCGSVGKLKTVIRGHFVLELLLWLFFLLPGVIYTVWRLSTTYSVCKICLSPYVIPVDTPRGKEFLETFNDKEGDSE